MPSHPQNHRTIYRWKLGIHIFWYVVFGFIVFYFWKIYPEIDALAANALIALLFGVPGIITLVIDYRSSVLAKRRSEAIKDDPYYNLGLSGSDIFRFPHLSDFVAHHAKEMEGTLYFFNIPLKTFKTKQNFKKIWIDAIGGNSKIQAIKMLLDKKFESDWRQIVREHKDFFTENQDRFYVKFDELRNSALLEDMKFSDKKREALEGILPFSHVNFGVWTSHDPRHTGEDIVTMTAEGTPWGDSGEIFHFLAINRARHECQEMCQEIRRFVQTAYKKAPGPEITPAQILSRY